MWGKGTLFYNPPTFHFLPTGLTTLFTATSATFFRDLIFLLVFRLRTIADELPIFCYTVLPRLLNSRLRRVHHSVACLKNNNKKLHSLLYLLFCNFMFGIFVSCYFMPCVFYVLQVHVLQISCPAILMVCHYQCQLPAINSSGRATTKCDFYCSRTHTVVDEWTSRATPRRINLRRKL